MTRPLPLWTLLATLPSMAQAQAPCPQAQPDLACAVPTTDHVGRADGSSPGGWSCAESICERLDGVPDPLNDEVACGAERGDTEGPTPVFTFLVDEHGVYLADALGAAA